MTFVPVTASLWLSITFENLILEVYNTPSSNTCHWEFYTSITIVARFSDLKCSIYTQYTYHVDFCIRDCITVNFIYLWQLSFRRKKAQYSIFYTFHWELYTSITSVARLPDVNCSIYTQYTYHADFCTRDCVTVTFSYHWQFNFRRKKLQLTLATDICTNP